MPFLPWWECLYNYEGGRRRGRTSQIEEERMILTVLEAGPGVDSSRPKRVSRAFLLQATLSPSSKHSWQRRQHGMWRSRR